MYCVIDRFEELAKMQAKLKSTDDTDGKIGVLLEYRKRIDTDFLKRVCNYVWGSIDFKVTSERVLEHLHKVKYFEALPLSDGEICEYLDGIPNGKGSEKAVDLCARIYGSVNVWNKAVAELFLNILDKDFKCGVTREMAERAYPDLFCNV